METNKLLEFWPDTKEHVKKLYNLDKPEKIKQAVELLREWLKRQDHFTKKDYDIRYLENLLIDTKGSIEKAKEKIEKRCVFRTVLPQFFEINDFNAEFGEFLEDQITGFPLPKLTKDHYRVVFFKIYNTDFYKKLPFITKYLKLNFLFNEYLKLHDCCAGYIYVIDIRDISVLDVTTKIKPIEFKQWATYYLEVQGTRLKKFIYVTPSKTAETLIKLIKPCFNNKMAERLEVYKDMEDLVHIVPREMWPIEVGGKPELSARENQDNWVKALTSKEFMDYYNDMRNARVNEKVNEDDRYRELAGSFVSLNFD